MTEQVEMIETVEETGPTEIEQYYSLGYDPHTKQVEYLFVNPFRTPELEDVDAFKDHIRRINVVVNNGAIDIEATERRVEEVARGIFNKMKLAAEGYVPENSNLEEEAIAAFGQMIEPRTEEPSEEPSE